MVGAFLGKLEVLAKGRVEVKIFAEDESRTPDFMLFSIAPLQYCAFTVAATEADGCLWV